MGYLPVVTQWESIKWGSFKVQKPVTLYCQPCGSDVEGRAAYRKRRIVFVKGSPEAPVLSEKQVAGVVWSHLSRSEARSSVQLAKLGGLDEDYVPAIKGIMKKLREAGKVIFTEEKRWQKV
jgi:hypothetical protein